VLSRLPPTVAPIGPRDLYRGLKGVVTGEGVEGFGRSLARYLGIAHCHLFSSGRAALVVALEVLHRALGRRKVVIPAYTCYSVPSAVVRAGLEVVLCDISRDTLGMDPSVLGGVVEEDRLCVLPAHLLGLPVEMGPVEAIARRHGVLVVEDAAQALGVRIQERSLGTFGDLGLFSLGRGKHLTTGGGGVLVTSSERWALAISSHPAYRDGTLGWPDLGSLAKLAAYSAFTRPLLYRAVASLPMLHIGESKFQPQFPIGRLGRVQAEVGTSLLGSLDRLNEVRLCNAQRILKGLSAVPGVEIPRVALEQKLPLLRVPILIGQPALRQRILEQGRDLGISQLYPRPVHLIPELAPYLPRRCCYPVSERVAEELVTIPCHPYISSSGLNRLVELVARVMEG